MSYSKEHLDEYIEITKQIDPKIVEKIVDLLSDVKSTGGRLFVLGVGGSAANASHAVNDFRKLAGIETYAPTDNVAELTAWRAQHAKCPAWFGRNIDHVFDR